MLAIISPAKTLSMDTQIAHGEACEPALIDQAAQLVDILKQLKSSEIATLMKLSDKLADLNSKRYVQWSLPSGPENARQAIFAFQGDVYQGLDAASLDKRTLNYANKHLLILSGLYGVLRAFDWLQAYRLEMGTRLPTPRGKDLYAFWGDRITQVINEHIGAVKAPFLVNLASQEYFKSVHSSALKVPVIEPVFKDEKNGEIKIISFYAKKARGLMARYLLVNRVKTLTDLMAFDVAGYRFNQKLSNEASLIFTRTEKAAQRYAAQSR